MATSIDIAPDEVGEALPTSVVPMALEQISGAHVQPVKIRLGAVNAGTTDLEAGQKTAADSISVIMASDATAPLPTGAATSAKQTEAVTLLTAISALAGDLQTFWRTMIESLRNPSWLDKSANRLRGTVIVESSGTVSQVTTVATTTNLAQLGTHQAQNLVLATERMSWAVNCRSRIT